LLLYLGLVVYCVYTICDLATPAANSLKITLILQPAHSDVKIGPARAHANRLRLKDNNNYDVQNTKHFIY